MRDMSHAREEVFDDPDLSADLKLFVLSVLHLYEHGPDQRLQRTTFRRSPWPYQALRLMGHRGTDDELSGRLLGLIAKDVPKYRVDMSEWPACVGVMLRPKGAPCRQKVQMRTMLVNPMTGERTPVGCCRRHEEALSELTRPAWAAYRANGEPKPAPNSGGVLLRYLSARALEALYAWADRAYTRGDVVPAAPDKPLAEVISLADRRPRDSSI